MAAGVKSMPASPLSVVVQHLMAEVAPGGGGMTDGELLARILSNRDHDALTAARARPSGVPRSRRTVQRTLLSTARASRTCEVTLPCSCQGRAPDLLAPAADVDQPARVVVENPEYPLVDVAVTLPVRHGGEQPPHGVERHVGRVGIFVLEPRKVPQPGRFRPQLSLQGFGEVHQDLDDARAGEYVGRHERGAFGREVVAVVGQLPPQPAGLPPARRRPGCGS